MKNKRKTNIHFPEDVVRSWEASDGVNFAVALARITGWLLHVDWWSPTDDKELVDNMKSLRVYVGNNSNQIYDLSGKHTIATFTNNIIRSIVRKRVPNFGCVVTRYYSESAIFNLPLRVRPDELRIQKAQELIKGNGEFLEKIPKRAEPIVPAHIAAKFTFGHCNPFATALSDLRGYKAIALIAKEYNNLFGLSKIGYAHSFNLNEQGDAIDIWGKDTIENIVQRFGVVKYGLDESEHCKVRDKLKNASPDKYEAIYNESKQIIDDFF